MLAVTEESLDPLQPFRHGPFGAVIGRPVITGAGQLVGQILLGGDAARLVVWVGEDWPWPIFFAPG